MLDKRAGLKEPMSKMLALKEAKEWLRELTTEQALEQSAAMKNGVVRASRGEKKVVVVGEVPKPTKAGEKPYAHPQYWAAFILIGDPH